MLPKIRQALLRAKQVIQGTWVYKDVSSFFAKAGAAAWAKLPPAPGPSKSVSWSAKPPAPKSAPESAASLFLTDFTGLKGWGCKIPKDELVAYLSASPRTLSRVFDVSPDCYTRQLSATSHLLTSLDFFYPLHDDPFTQGQITVCNVLSDVYASGVVDIDHFLVVLSLSTRMSREQREQVAVQLMAGMENKLGEAGTVIGGGQTVFNPWVTTGGSVTAFFDSRREGFELFSNRDAVAGDVLVLTKPLGTQLAINFAQYLRRSAKYNPAASRAWGQDLECGDTRRIDAVREQLPFFDAEFIGRFTRRGFDYMSDLNLYASKCMREQMKTGRVRACTDVTGFGLKGHAENLAKIQTRSVDFVLDRFVTLDRLDLVDAVKHPHARDFALMQGYTPESSGGLLIVMSAEAAAEFVQQFSEEFGRQAWVVGRVVEGERRVYFNPGGLDIEYA